MKYELQIFNKNKIEYIKKNYSVDIESEEPKKEKKSSILELSENTKRHIKIMKYKELLDNGKIEEKDIPKEFIEELRKIYKEKIRETQNKINNDFNRE